MTFSWCRSFFSTSIYLFNKDECWQFPVYCLAIGAKCFFFIKIKNEACFFWPLLMILLVQGRLSKGQISPAGLEHPTESRNKKVHGFLTRNIRESTIIFASLTKSFRIDVYLFIYMLKILIYLQRNFLFYSFVRIFPCYTKIDLVRGIKHKLGRYLMSRYRKQISRYRLHQIYGQGRNKLDNIFI